MGSEVVLLWLAQGAVAYIGGRVMAGIVGDPTIANIEGIVRAAIAEINAFTRQAIDENEIRKLVASMDAVLRNLGTFSLLLGHKDQLDNDFLLTDAILKTGDAMSQCKSLGIPAVFCYVNAVSLNLIAKAAFYKLHGTADSAQVVRALVSEAKLSIDSLMVPFELSWEPTHRIAAANPMCLMSAGYQDDVIGKCWVMVDGQRKQVFDGIGPVSAGDYQGFIDDELALARTQQTQAVQGVVVPVRSAVAEWDKALVSENFRLLPMA